MLKKLKEILTFSTDDVLLRQDVAVPKSLLYLHKIKIGNIFSSKKLFVN